MYAASPLNQGRKPVKFVLIWSFWRITIWTPTISLNCLPICRKNNPKLFKGVAAATIDPTTIIPTPTTTTTTSLVVTTTTGPILTAVADGGTTKPLDQGLFSSTGFRLG
jgi:hypothetical protein